MGKQILVSPLSLALLFATWPHNLSADQDAQTPAQAAPPPYTEQTSEQLQQLVAPIALYPDSLVAQILAASTFPEQVVEADRWVQAHPDLKGDALAKAVDQQPWDPSIKALTAFTSVLGNMDQNLSWTSSLGDAYYNQPTLDYGYRGRPAYTGYQYGGLPFYGGQSGAPLNPYAPYPLAGGNYGSAPTLWPGTPSYGGGYAPYSSALYLPSFYTGGQPFSNLYC